MVLLLIALLYRRIEDIGKLGVSNRILDKPGKLDEREWEAMRRHPRVGERGQ